MDPLGRVADSASEKEEPESGLDYLEGDSRGDLLESWPLENSLSVWFHRTLRPLLLASSEEERHRAGVTGVWLLSSAPLPSPSPPTLPCPRLTLGSVAATTGADTLLLTQEVVRLPSASAVSKGLA